MPNVPNRFPLVVKDRLLTVFNEEVGGDVAVIREYRGIACGLRISMRKREECIEELKALGDRQGVAETVRFMEALQADEMDRCNRTLSLMREVEVKAYKKSRFILKLSGYKGNYNDMRLGTEINALCARLTVIVDARVNFVNELNILPPEFVPVKIAELMKQIQDKDIRNLMKLQTLGREFEQRGLVCDISTSTEEDRQIATKLNRLREELLVLCKKRRNITHELRIFRSIVVVSKAAEFVAESVTKANDQATQIALMEDVDCARERACEIDLFVQNLRREDHLRSVSDVCYVSVELRDTQLFVAIWGPMITELRYIVGSSDWIEVLSVRSRHCCCNVSELLIIFNEGRGKMAQLRELERQLELRALGRAVQMMSLYCESLAADERNFAGRLSDLLQEMINAYDKKVEFIQELEAVPGIVATVKTDEFLNENLWKDNKRIQKLRNMNIDAGVKADEMENFAHNL
ncbi:hypothetical protein Tco_1375846 [Tanacetum coccineum]